MIRQIWRAHRPSLPEKSPRQRINTTIQRMLTPRFPKGRPVFMRTSTRICWRRSQVDVRRRPIEHPFWSNEFSINRNIDYLSINYPTVSLIK
jgi:hypothetical protein